MSILRYKIAKRIYNKVCSYKQKKHSHMMRILKLYDKDINHGYKRCTPHMHKNILKRFLPNNISDFAPYRFLHFNVQISDYALDMTYRNARTMKFNKLFNRIVAKDKYYIKITQDDNVAWFCDKYGIIPPTRMLINYGDSTLPLNRPLYCNFKGDTELVEASWIDVDLLISYNDFARLYKRAYDLYIWKEICSPLDRFLYKTVNFIPLIKKKINSIISKLKAIIFRIKAIDIMLQFMLWFEVVMLLIVFILTCFLQFK